MKIKITESELVRVIKLMTEDHDDLEFRMRRRKGELLNLIQKEVQTENPDNFEDEFEYADNILSWALDKFIKQPGNEWLEDRYDELMYDIKEEFGEQLFEVYRSAKSYDEFDDDDFDM